MSANQEHSGLSSAPPELLYAMVLATRASINSPKDETLHTNSIGITELLRVAEHLPVADGETSLAMASLVSAATGFHGFKEKNPQYAFELVVPEIQEVVLRYTSAQAFINNYMERELSRKFDFTSQADAHLVFLTEVAPQVGREST